MKYKNRKDSMLVHDGDPFKDGNEGATEKKYKQNNFVPTNEVERFSYTSGRVAKRVYNKYKRNKHKVIGYYTDWSQYDGRYERLYEDSQCGRGVDLMMLDPYAYDKLIIGFAGIVGDKGEKRDTIQKAAQDFGKKEYEATFVDAWGDVASYRNCGFDGWIGEDYQQLFNQDTAQGVLGGLRKLKEKNPELILSFSVGGWTMSEAFHEMTRNEDARKIFIDSICYVFDKFPMFTEVDIDWEYPGMEGNGNPFASDDAIYFQHLIRELKQKLPDVVVSIATSASPKGLSFSDIPGMINAGVEIVNLMTYDFFGTPWAEKLAHHTNIYALDNQNEDVFGIDKAINILIDSGVKSENIMIGYAAYTRNAKNANIESLSPLRGSYEAGAGTTTGTFESGVTEWYDLIYNYLDLENQKGMNGFDVYSDTDADADYLYNSETKLFMSYDSPRAVKAKGEYIKKYNLGGAITWTIEQDNGLLINAMREGLGCDIVDKVIDMTPFYFYGINIDDNKVKAVISGPEQGEPGEEVTFSAEKSIGVDLQYQWRAIGIEFLDGKKDKNLSGKLPLVEGEYIIELTVTDKEGSVDKASCSIVIKNQSQENPVAQAFLELSSGTEFRLSAEKSTDPQSLPLTYSWDAKNLPFDGDDSAVIDTIVPDIEEPTDYLISLTVGNGKLEDVTNLTLHAIPKKNMGKPRSKITGKTEVFGGDDIFLSAESSVGEKPLKYKWSAPELTFDGENSVDVLAVAPVDSNDVDYSVSLTVEDVNGNKDTDSVTVKVKSIDENGDWVPKSYNAGDVVTHNYQGNGMHRYQAKWWAESYMEPGSPECTSEKENGDDKVWWDKGSV